MVLCGVAVLVALPAVIAALPVRQSGIAAADLLARIRQPTIAPYSGYAEASGGVALPVTRQLGDVADLFGGTTQLRVWWRGASDWRVDTISVAGESDMHAGPRGTWTWDYEANRATWTGGTARPAVRLPRAGDLLPTNLARRMLSEANPDEVTRLASKRVAGRDAPGLRLRPRAPASTIDHVDVWADRRTGLAVRVDIAGGGSRVLSTAFLDFATHVPAAAETAFVPPRTAQVRTRDEPDLAAEIDRFGDATPPPSLAGLARNAALPSFGAIGVYGTGVTEFAVVPLPVRTTFSLMRQLGDAAARTPSGLAMVIGPLSLLLTDPDPTGGSWLLTGTVTPDTLAKAAAQVLGGTQ